ncbi:MAG: flagellar hook capping FlgD N-terminal domain-containing protein [Fulvimonas sp.]|nr:flagellar hook capping FlgD N-terminal domain-containing protein [Fulvimonas sp.]
MSSVNQTQAATAASTASAGSVASAAATGSMSQADFLKLLTTQLQTQDPTHPLDNSQFVSQLAQFSQLASTQELASTVESLGGQITSALQTSQVLGSSNLVGRQVLVPSSSLAYAGSPTSGAVNVASAGDVAVVIRDGTGKVVRTLDLGAQPAGLASFSWDGLDDSGKPVAAGSYQLAADSGGNALSTYVAGTVSGVGYGGSSVGTYLEVAGVGGVPLSAVAQIN